MGCNASEPKVAKPGQEQAPAQESPFVKPDMKQIEAIFAKMDAGKTGKMDAKQLNAGFQQLGMKVSQTDLDAVVQLIDQNGDRSVDLKEFYHLVYIIKNVRPSEREKIVFLVADVDCSGKITSKELYGLFKKLGIEISQKDVEKEVKEFSKGDVTYDVFLKIIAKLDQPKK